jgi:hypothetical protein
MRSTPHLGLTVWDSNNDTFNSTQLAANWDAIDADYTRARPANQVQVVTTVASVPSPVEGTLAYLSAADSGFAAGTLIRRTASTWKPVPGVELLSAVPSSGNFAGRMVLLSVANGGFAQWSLINYTGSVWQMLNHTYELLATVPTSGNFAGRLVLLTTANGGFNAYDLIRYTGSTWAKIGPQAVPPATELLTYTISTDAQTTNTVSPGDLLNSFAATTFENVKYYFEVSIPWLSHTIAQGGGQILLREGSTTIASLSIPTANTATAPTNFVGKAPFIPTAASHTYTLYWYTLTAGTLTIFGATYSNALVRVVKA